MLHQKGNCRVFIPDLYKGKTAVEVAEAKHVSLMLSLTCSKRFMNQVLPSSLWMMVFCIILSEQYAIVHHGALLVLTLLRGKVSLSRLVANSRVQIRGMTCCISNACIFLADV